ncbi:DNA polymerase subunit gamma-2 [Eleutherodactylus coqui]|uniref:Anticodon-binding domain-containing protein n=1 Tax=Eleutherodactylus coqui TaxID=57060 RepID=A0A8J6JQW8_ELECQ|nr:hypothetical protein GDO78_013767 [Eleutherodactylus coqui]
MPSLLVRVTRSRERRSLLKSFRCFLRLGLRLYASPSTSQIHDLLLDLCRCRHFILGKELTMASVLGGCHSLGPLGIEMKKNIISEWWNMVALNREQVLPIQTLLRWPPQPELVPQPLLRMCPDNKYESSSRVGPVTVPDKHQGQHIVLRQDLLQGALSHYIACLELVNRKLPFGISEVGTCFHTTQDGPDNNLHHTRTGERTAASLCWFSSAKTTTVWHDYWLRHRLLWWRRFAHIPSGFSSSEHQDTEGAKTFVINYDFPWGKEPVETLCMMDDSVLAQVHPGADTKLHGREGRKSVVPHLVWLNCDLDRGLLVYLSDALSLRGKEPRRAVLKIHPSLAPMKVAVDLGKGPAVDLRLVCQGLLSEMRGSGISVWPGYLDTVQTPMEQLFTKYDEMGIMFTVLVSDVTLESGLLQLRNRDTTIKETLHISKLRSFLTQYISAANKL